MVYNSEKHHRPVDFAQGRRSIRVKGYDYSSEGWYYVTLCAQNREFLFGDVEDGIMILNEFGKIVDKIWKKLPERYPIEVDEYIIMPNHFHGVINIVGEEKGRKNKVGVIHESPQRKSPQRDLNDIKVRRKMILPKIVGYFKMNSAKKINQMREKTGSSVWQRDYYEHIIRDEKDLIRIRKYIINNPGKWQDDKYYN